MTTNDMLQGSTVMGTQHDCLCTNLTIVIHPQGPGPIVSASYDLIAFALNATKIINIAGFECQFVSAWHGNHQRGPDKHSYGSCNQYFGCSLSCGYIGRAGPCGHARNGFTTTERSKVLCFFRPASLHHHNT